MRVFELKKLKHRTNEKHIIQSFYLRFYISILYILFLKKCTWTSPKRIISELG